MMPRSSRNKSSKHSSRDYSDSEKEKKSKDKSSNVMFSKELESGEKRKLENGDYMDEYGSSKRRKYEADDGVGGDRWNVGEEDGKGEKKRKSYIESNSKRREHAEGKHRESSRKEESEREKKDKEGKSDQLIDSQEHRNAKQFAERTELIIPDWLQSPESESQPDRRLRGDGDKHLEDNGDILDKHLSVSNNTGKDGRKKDEKHKDEKYKDKYREDKCQDDKLRYDRSASGHANSKSSEKHLRDGKDDVKVRQKKSKVQDSDVERDRDLDRERDRDRDHECRERDREQDTGRDRERKRYRDVDRDHYRERHRNRDHDHDQYYDSQWDQDHDREHDRRYSNRDKDRDLDHDELHDERRSVRYKYSKGKKRSSDDRDDGNDTKSRGAKLQYPDMGNISSTSRRGEVDADRGRSQSRPANLDAAMGSNKITSPSSISHCGTDDYRHFKQEDPKYRDPTTEHRSKAASSREVTSFSETPERGAKYRSMEKSIRVNEGHSGKLPTERSSSSKASPMERSPSTSIDRRHMSRSGVKRGLDIEEMGWSRASNSGREEDNRLSRDLPPEKPFLDGYSQADSVFYNRTGQGNSSLIPQQPGSRAATSSPSFMGSLEEDNRFNNSGRYKRSGDMNVRRGHANAWRGAPNWPGPVPNGFIPFQPGPPHGGFQAMIPQFPSPSLFGVRPSMEINHSGMPYHIPDAERFNNHLHPMGWQNVMDGSGPAHFHGWDGHNVNFRDEAHMFGGPKWDQNRHPVNGEGWETSTDVWKGQNGYVDLTSTSQKEDHPLQAPLNDVFDGQERRRSQYENDSNGVQVKGLEMRSDFMSPFKESSKVSPEIPQKAPDSSKISSEDNEAHYLQLYLCKLDISADLAGSDLYDQCMSLVNVKGSKDLVKDVSMLVNLKNGGRPVKKASIAVLSPSLIPATNASVFQKAMDLYKKQRLQMV